MSEKEEPSADFIAAHVAAYTNDHGLSLHPQVEADLGKRGERVVGIAERTGVAECEWDVDDNRIYLEDGDGIGVCDLIQEAVGEEVLNRTQQACILDKVGFWPETQEEMARWKKRHKRQWPPLYRVRIRVEAEILPDEEAGEVWRKRKKL